MTIAGPIGGPYTGLIPAALGISVEINFTCASGEFLVTVFSAVNKANTDVDDGVLGIPTDDVGGTWFQAIQVTQPGTVRRDIANCAIFYKPSATGAETTVTCALSQGTTARKLGGILTRWTGVLAAGSLDVGSVNSNHVTNAVGTLSLNSGPTGVHEQNNNLCIVNASIGDDDHTDATADGGFVIDDSIFIVGGTEADMTMALFWRIISDGASQDPTVTYISGGDESMTVAIASFKDVDPGGGGPGPSTALSMII